MIVIAEEMKLRKFESIVKSLNELLGRTCCMEGKPIALFLGEEGNDYYKIILNNSFNNVGLRCNGIVGQGQITIDKFIEGSEFCTLNCGDTKCNIKYPLIFWLLMALAVDKEKYTSSLSVVSDTAYLLGFSEAMLEDWTKAIRAVLLGEDIRSVTYKTDEASKVFY